MRWGPRARKNLSESRGRELIWESTADTPSDSGSAAAVGGIAITRSSSVSTSVWGRSDWWGGFWGWIPLPQKTGSSYHGSEASCPSQQFNPLKYLHSWLPCLFTYSLLEHQPALTWLLGSVWHFGQGNWMTITSTFSCCWETYISVTLNFPSSSIFCLSSEAVVALPSNVRKLGWVIFGAVDDSVLPAREYHRTSEAVPSSEVCVCRNATFPPC